MGYHNSMIDLEMKTSIKYDRVPISKLLAANHSVLERRTITFKVVVISETHTHDETAKNITI